MRPSRTTLAYRENGASAANRGLGIRRIAASVGTVGLGITVALAPGGPASASGAAAAAGHPNSWGTGNLGQLGNGSTANHFTPTTVNIVASQISAGREHGLAVSGGAAYAWGWNNYGQLGDGTTGNRATPGKVAGACAGSKVAEVAAGHYSSLARCADGTAWGWGRDDTGQLGDAGTRAVTHPQRIPGLTGVIQIAGGRNHSIALRSSGTVWAWGSNTAGQLGIGSTAARVGPAQVIGLPAGIIGIVAGRDHSLALSSAGNVYAWGANEYGELGDGTETDRATPVRVLSGAKTARTGHTLGAGAYHSLAVMADGTVRAWGRNTNGQLGDGTVSLRLTPVATTGLIGVTAVAGGRDHSLACASGGAVYAWGKNTYGQLGDGTTTNRRTPTRVVGVSATSVSGGKDFSLAL